MRDVTEPDIGLIGLNNDRPATFLLVVGVLLAYWPKGISFGGNNQIQLSTYNGHFKNTKTGQKMLLYLTGKQSKICFTYNGELYVVDDWRL